MRNTEKVIFMNMCMICAGDGRVVMQKRKGSWAGLAFPGGHVEKGESFADAVSREVLEETGLKIHSPTLCGIKDWISEDGIRSVVHLYKATEFEGVLTSSSEGEVAFMSLDSIPESELAEGMRELIPLFSDESFTEQFFTYENGKWTGKLK